MLTHLAQRADRPVVVIMPAHSPAGRHQQWICKHWCGLLDYEQIGTFETSGVPKPRVKQILQTVLALPSMEGVPAKALRVDVHRPDAGKYHHDYGLAVGLALVSSLARKPIGEPLLFLGDVDLQGRVRDVAAKSVDRLNEAVAAFEIETPIKIVCAPDTAAWVNSSSTVVVIPTRTLADAVAAVWPGMKLHPQH